MHRVFASVVAQKASQQAAARAALWLRELPPGAPEPMVFPGHDRTISLEWDRDGETLHVLFDDEGGEWYFESAEGGSQEGTLVGSVQALTQALRDLADD